MTRSRRGIALLTSLVILLVVGGIAALMFTRTMAEIRHSGDDSGIIQSLMLARGAANMGGAVLQGPIRTAFDAIVNDAAIGTNPWSFGTGTVTSTEPEPGSVVQVLSTNVSSVANRLQAEINALICTASVPGLDPGESLSLRIHVINGQACGQPLPSGVTVPTGRFVEGTPRGAPPVVAGESNRQTYALPFVIVAEGRSGVYSRSIVTSGEYHFVVGQGSFAQYALFTNVHRTDGGSSGQDVWFTDNTLFDGPVHTNQHFRFYRNPWFGGRVTSAGCTNPGATSCSSGANNHGAYFHNVSGLVSASSMTPPEAPSYSNSTGTHAPEFAGGVGWQESFIRLPATSNTQRDAAIAGGIYFNNDPVHRLTLRATDALMNNMPADGSGTAAYQFIEGCYTITSPNRWQCAQYRIDAGGIMQRRLLTYPNNNDTGTPTVTTWSAMPAPHPGTFNGALFVTGSVTAFSGPPRTTANNPSTAPPALAGFAQVTVAADGDIHINGDLKYQHPPCTGTPTRVSGTVVPANCTTAGLAATNILGVYTQNGSVVIGHNYTGTNSYRNAPNDVTIHGSLMSARHRVEVRDFASGTYRGNINLLGGIIEYYYGAFGTFNSNTGQNVSGFSRAFTFDRRMGLGLAPPYFPTVAEDTVVTTTVYSFGQREQLE